MRTIEEIKKDYKVAEKDTEMELQSGYCNIYAYKNQKLRDKLREEYISLLPVNKQLAIFLHKRLCNNSHTDQCSFYYEVKGVEDDWTRYAHKEYLKKADKMLEDIKSKEPNKSDEEAFELVKAVLNYI